MCSKDFARMDYLRKHQMLHSSDTKFCCGDCGELCGSLDGLKKHMKHQHQSNLGNLDKSIDGTTNIDITSFEDLGLQMPSIYGGDSVLEAVNELQAVSIDGGKTIMILNETEHSVYTEVKLQEGSGVGGSGEGHLIITAGEEGGLEEVEGSVMLGTIVEPQEVLYAVEY